MVKEKAKYKEEKCDCCGQTTTYIIGIDKGTVDILKGVAKAIGRKGINCVHVNRELVVDGDLTPIQMTNMSRPRSHGLIAKVKGEMKKGNYLLTRKGSQFLKGGRVPKYAVMSKVTGHQIGYHEPNKHNVIISDFKGKGEYWEGVNYTIERGEVVPVPKVDNLTGNNKLF